MMIFKSQRGSANVLLAFAFAVVSAIVVVNSFSNAQKAGKTWQRNREESQQLMISHSMAALLKQELMENFQRIRAANPTCIPNTFGTEQVLYLLESIDTLKPTCAFERFILNRFRFSGGGSSVLLHQLKMNSFSPVINNTPYNISLRFTSLTLEALRMNGIIQFSVKNPSAKTQKILSGRTLNFFVDANRTLSSLKLDNSCRVCRTQPGSVCCGEDLSEEILTVLYMESGSGRVMQLTKNFITGVTTTNPIAGNLRFPAAVSVKNVTSTPTVYFESSFKIAALDPVRPIRYVVDTATDDSGNTYYLGSSGSILDSMGKAVAYDPKISSLSYSAGRWYFLRNDGVVLTALDITRYNSYQFTGIRLPTAEKLVTGLGTTDKF